VNNEIKVDIKLSTKEINTVLEALSNMPYNRVNVLIPNISTQAQTQIKEEEGHSGPEIK
jgi:hypothetical protein